MRLTTIISTAIAVLLAHAAAAQPWPDPTMQLGGQWGAPHTGSGQVFSDWLGMPQPNLGGYCGPSPDGGSNCAMIPPGKTMVGVHGSVGIKQTYPNIELLVALVCGMGPADYPGFETIRRWHLFAQEDKWFDITGIPPSIYTQGDGAKACWFMWQIINGGTNADPGSAIEIQATFDLQ